MLPPAGSRRVLGINDLRGTPYVTGSPRDLYGLGVVFGYADTQTLGIPNISINRKGTLTVNAMGDSADMLDCIHREFQLDGTKYVQRPVSPAQWGAWELHDYDHSGFARLHHEQEFTEPQLFSRAVFEGVVDMGTDTEIDVRLGGVFVKTVTEPTELTIIGASLNGVSSFALYLSNGGAAELTWWEGVAWPGGQPPSLSVDGLDLLGFISIDGGLSWQGVELGLAYSP